MGQSTEHSTTAAREVAKSRYASKIMIRGFILAGVGLVIDQGALGKTGLESSVSERFLLYNDFEDM